MGFHGGIHPDYSKITADKSIESAKLPEKVVLPLSQHIGAPCEPIVKVGDYVKTGQLIAKSDAFVSSPLHASVSGTIRAIDLIAHPISGKLVKAIIIESDGKDEMIEMGRRDHADLSKEELIKIIKEAGIVGLGGAAFPTHVKLSPPKEKPIDTLIINGAECEPYLTCDHRLMLEKTNDLIIGIKILKQILDVKHTYIGIEDNKHDAIKKLREKCENKNIEVVALPTKYPQGAEKTLIYAITKRKVPAGGLPMDIGCVVDNIGTTIAIYEAVVLSKPLYERVITLTGKVNNPSNVLVRNGVLVKDLIDEFGGYKGEPMKLINGGPMMGFAMPNDDVPIMKGTSGFVVFNKEDIDDKKEIECIRCGKCVESCPMNLRPDLIAAYAKKNRIEGCEKVFAMDCFECGCCAYVCPSNIPLVQWIRYAKAEIMKKKKAEQAKEEKKK